jgi:PleD family two-component response regulator
MEKVGNLLREKILIVDDTRFHRAMAADILTRMGYATVEVDDGAKALDMVTTESPDLIILDSMMPGLDGLEVCRRLKGDPFTHHIPILLFTTHNTVPDKVNSLRTGADAYLGKPFTPEELIAEVEALLRRSFHYDPLTKLPAAPYLHRQIDARLAQNQPTAVLYVDIDHFRAYNHAYGHESGDHLLMDVARLMVDSLPSRSAFVGHLGSDDFMAVMSPPGSDTFAQTLVDQFKGMQRHLFTPEDFARGYFTFENRRGDLTKWPLITLSVALVGNDTRVLINYVQVSDLLSEVMGFVKSNGGGMWARDRRRR